MRWRQRVTCARFAAETWVRRRVALAPWLRLAAIPLWLAGAIALLVSGLLSIDFPLRAWPGFLSGAAFLYLGAMCWGLE